MFGFHGLTPVQREDYGSTRLQVLELFYDAGVALVKGGRLIVHNGPDSMNFPGRSLVVIAICLAGRAPAEDWQAEAQRLRPADSSASEQAVYRNLAAKVKVTLDALPRAETRAAADAARPKLQRELRHSLGYERLPTSADLHARVTATVRKNGYRIEDVVYEGLPGESIPANLYLPDPPRGRAPGILFYNGHWYPDSKARPDFQAFCINMARLGFVVLNFETYGQGERGLSWRDHRRAEGLPVGVAQQGYAVYDTQTALRFLLSRPEVDPQGIGMTGASGGGFDTWMNAALDDRIKVAVPVVGTCDLYEQFAGRLSMDWDPKDHCHYVPGLFRYANNHELLAMAAPKPILIVSATEDKSFPVAGVREVVEYGRRLYKSYGLSDHFAYSEDSSEGHGYQIKKREAAYGWFLHWLMNKGDGSPMPEPATETLPFDSAELHAFTSADNRAAGPAMVAAAQHLALDLPPHPARLRLDQVLGAWPSPIPWTPQLSAKRLQRLLAPSERGLDVPAFLLRPAGAVKGLLVTVDDRGKEAALADAAVKEALEDGWAVLGVDPRAIGESKTSKNTWLFAGSVMEGQNLIWMQTWDILRSLDGVSQTPEFRNVPIALSARGQDSSLALTYLLAYWAEAKRPKLNWFVMRDGFLTYRDFLDRPKSLQQSYQLIQSDQDKLKPLDREIPWNLIPFDVLDYFDIPQLLSSPAVPGLMVNPIDGDWTPKPAAKVRALLDNRVRFLCKDAPDAEIAAFVRER
jgi:dienelactone hydrolase